jgi:hypothetical protein
MYSYIVSGLSILLFVNLMVSEESQENASYPGNQIKYLSVEDEIKLEIFKHIKIVKLSLSIKKIPIVKMVPQ